MPRQKPSPKAEELRKAIGLVIRKERDRKALSADGLAKLIGCSRQHIHKLEKGDAEVTVELLYQLTEALGTVTTLAFLMPLVPPEIMDTNPDAMNRFAEGELRRIYEGQKSRPEVDEVAVLAAGLPSSELRALVKLLRARFQQLHPKATGKGSLPILAPDE